MEEQDKKEISSYRDLKVWKMAMDLTDEIYRLSKRLPKEELFSLSSQMRRAAVSIPSNIAEGNERRSPREYLHFLHIASGSCAELETQIEICKRQQFFSESELKTAREYCKQVGKMLNSLQDKIQMRIE